jgi:uncharacterized membrane protein
MEERPRIKIELSGADRILESVGWLALIFLWVLTILNYTKMPESVPIHFNAAGEVNGYGNKASIFILPVTGLVVFIGMTILNRFPHIFNYPVNITLENAEKQYLNATRTVRYLKSIIVITFLIIEYQTIQTVTGKSEGLGVWFFPVTMGLILIPTIVFVIRAYRTK